MYGSANPNASSAYSDSSCHHVSVVPGPSPHRSPTYNMGGVPNTASIMNMGGPISQPDNSMSGSTALRTTTDPQVVNTIYLLKTILALLNNPPAHSIVHFQGPLSKQTSLLIVDTGATDHMLPYKSALIFYYQVSGRYVRMGHNSFAFIVGHGLP
jgi:hypothetical protein